MSDTTPAAYLRAANARLDTSVTRVETLERRKRALDADRARELARVLDIVAESGLRGGERELLRRSIVAECATALGLSEEQILSEMSRAATLVHHFPEALARLASGTIGAEHARVIVAASDIIGSGPDAESAARRAAYEREVIVVAERETPNRLRPTARRIAEKYAESGIDERHTAAASARRVTVIDREDGMADLLAFLPSAEAHAIYDRLTRIAKHVHGAAGQVDGAAGQGQRTSPPATDHRSRDEVRADTFAELLLSSDPATLTAGAPEESFRARVQVVLTATSSPDGTLDEASFAVVTGELQGAGPIGPRAAGRIAASADAWENVVTTLGGVVRSVDRYRPSPEMRRRLGARDGHCRFAGCRVPLPRCDLDHTVDAARGGRTTETNLAHLCRHHHTLKHHGGWDLTQHPSNGTLTLVSPTGRVHTDVPEGLARGAATGVKPGPGVRFVPADTEAPSDSDHPF
ncbi:HNH endonuclease [Leucobacter chromiireducens]|uniref:HNH endonuclease n=1 Tax=Leucobacter chromiireducens TaxID=283877 RepID=UPI000F62F115|nr:HNH endonuclease signature motif containing protein [Leucobacter chromiireducens]